jgi:DNA recombination protein RmuC
MLTLVFSVLVAMLAGGLLAWLFEHSRGRARRAEMEKSARTLHAQWAEAASALEQSRNRAAAHEATIARLEERVAAEQRALEQMRASLPDTFKSLASEILEEKSQQFTAQNQANLGAILEPLRSKLTDFQQKIEAAHLQQVEGGATLRAQVDKLMESTARISAEANQLASALKGSSKVQGAWGELILERILESAGLRKGREYEAQESYVTENGRRAQPDVVVHLPGARHLIIDSKVSLIDYEAHSNAETEAARSAALAGHLNSVRTHIRGLAEKKYQALYGLNSLDFVIMFLPVEPAFMLAISRDEKLWEEAWQRNVLLVGPSTLLFVVRTVAYLWRQEQQERNVEEIARRGAELYDKLARFAEDFIGMGKRLEDAQSYFASALNKLSTGRGNVIRQAEMLKALGVKPSRQLPQGLVEVAQQEALDLGPASEE